MRIALAVLMALHGAAHLVGFVGSWQLAGADSKTPYKATLLARKLDLGGVGVRAMGVFWLLTALAFMVAAAGAFTNQSWWLLTTLGVALFSLTLCITALPETRIGIAVNLLLMAALLLGQWAELLSVARCFIVAARGGQDGYVGKWTGARSRLPGPRLRRAIDRESQSADDGLPADSCAPASDSRGWASGARAVVGNER
jgi:hypothetical protein